MNATIVFEQNWQSINEVGDDGKQRYRYVINSGSSRSSKTYSIIQLFYFYAVRNPGKKLSVFRDTKQICKQTVFEDMKKVYVDMPFYNTVTLNLTESIFKFKNGSSIHIEGTDDPVKIHGYHCDVLWLNEGYNISKETFDQLDMRCKDFVILDLNPRQEHWSEDIAKYNNAKLIHSTFLENPYCPPEQRIKILSYQSVKYCEIVTSGILNEQDARSYSLVENPLLFTEKQLKELIRCRDNERKNSANDFNYDVYAKGIKAERPNRIFKWKSCTDDFYYDLKEEIITGVDWGAVDPWGIVDAKYYDGCLYLHERNYLSEGKLREKLTATETAQISEDEEGFVVWYFNKFGIEKDRKIICDTNRPRKISGLRKAGWVYAARAPSKSILDGIDVLTDIQVFYTESSLNLKYEQENYSRQVDRYGIVLEEPEDLNNHLIDPARYIALYLKKLGIIKKI